MAIVEDASRLIKAVSKDVKDGAGVTARARVTAIDGKTAWVSIVGGSSRTPCDMAVSCAIGDQVIVLISGGKATITSNISSPSTDDSKANAAYQQSDEAMEAALQVYNISVAAQDAASRAVTDAATANTAATAAAAAAAAAQTSADTAQSSANQALSDAATASASAASALSAATSASESAATALTQAQNALSSATEANIYAMGAHMGLSEVERVVGTLNWISEHGEYVATSDQAIDPTKVYYTRTGSGTEGSPYVYTQVTDPTVESIGSYYELVIDDSVQNYIASHLSQTDYGLDLMVDGSDARVHIGSVDGSNAVGTYIIDSAGVVVAKLASDGVVIGAVTGIHTEMKGGRLSFMAKGYHLPDSISGVTSDDVLPGEVAYIAVNESTNESMLHMTRAKVMKGLMFGKWQWKARDNGNMALMWVGE